MEENPGPESPDASERHEMQEGSPKKQLVKTPPSFPTFSLLSVKGFLLGFLTEGPG